MDTGSRATTKRGKLSAFLFRCFNVGISEMYHVPIRDIVHNVGCLLKFINAPAYSDQVLPFHCYVPRASFLGVCAHRHRGVSACV